MIEITSFINNIKTNSTMQLIIAIAILILCWILSAPISKSIIKIVATKEKGKKKDSRKNPFYRPLKTIIRFLGIYIAFIMTKDIFQLGAEIQTLISKALKILMIFLVAKAFGASLDEKNLLLKKLHEKTNKEVDETTTKLLIRAIKVIVYVIAIFIAISELGYDISGFITGLGITGVVITLAAQDTAKSLIGGIAIFMDRPFKVGDYIKVENYEGTVEDIRFRSTSIRTPEDSVLHIPNSKMSEVAIINYSEMKRRRYNTSLILETTTGLQKVEMVKQKIEKMLNKREDVIPNSIIVKFQEILGYGISITIIAYINKINYAEFLESKEQINYEIMKILESERISLTYNLQSLYEKN